MSLKLTDIVKDFQVEKKTMRAVDVKNIEFESGKFHTLLGPSGCGKTTLLRMIAGFETPTAGEIICNGQQINEIPPQKRGFSMVFQSYALFPHMNVTDNIAYGLKLKKLERTQISKKVDSALALLGLNSQKNKYAHQLSGGQQQRVALARALVMEPEIILFDEPLSNLDAKLRIFMRDEIRALQKRLGITAIYVTHDQEEAMAISDQIVVLNKGKVEQIGSPTEIYRKPATEFVADFIGGANVVAATPLDGVKFQLLGADYDFVADSNENLKKAIIRPEAIRISSSSGKHSARIESATFLGSKVNYKMICNEATLSADVSWTGREEIFKPGDLVRFDIEKSTLHFI